MTSRRVSDRNSSAPAGSESGPEKPPNGHFRLRSKWSPEPREPRRPRLATPCQGNIRAFLESLPAPPERGGGRPDLLSPQLGLEGTSGEARTGRGGCSRRPLEWWGGRGLPLDGLMGGTSGAAGSDSEKHGRALVQQPARADGLRKTNGNRLLLGMRNHVTFRGGDATSGAAGNGSVTKCRPCLTSR